MIRLPIYILAGGRSMRFGSDKARAEVGHGASLVNVARMVEPIAARVTAVAELAGKYDDLGVRTIGDTTALRRGPLEGMLAALADAGDDAWILLVSCDLLICRVGWIDRLWNQRRSTTPAVAFRDRRWQPFPSLLHTSARPVIERRLGADERSVQGLYDAMGAAAVALPPDWPATPQFNTPGELAQGAHNLSETPDPPAKID